MADENAFDRLMNDLGFPRRAIDDATESLLWHLYRNHCSAVARKKLIEQNVGLVVHAALRLSARLPRHIGFADLASMGMTGLIQSIDRFDPSRDVQFNTFASQRIAGEIIEGLRQIDRSVGRKARKRQRQHYEIVRSFAAEHGRPPTHDEIEQRLPTMTETIRRHWWADVRRAMPTTSLEHVFEGDQTATSLRELLADGSAGQQIERIDTTDERDFMMAGLPRAVAEVVRLIRDDTQFTTSKMGGHAVNVKGLAERLGVSRETIHNRVNVAKKHFAQRRAGVASSTADRSVALPATFARDVRVRAGANREPIIVAPQVVPPKTKRRAETPTAPRVIDRTPKQQPKIVKTKQPSTPLKAIARELWTLLTPRQREVCERRERGMTTGEIAAELKRSPHTIKALAKQARYRIAARGPAMRDIAYVTPDPLIVAENVARMRASLSVDARRVFDAMLDDPTLVAQTKRNKHRRLAIAAGVHPDSIKQFIREVRRAGRTLELTRGTVKPRRTEAGTGPSHAVLACRARRRNKSGRFVRGPR